MILLSLKIQPKKCVILIMPKEETMGSQNDDIPASSYFGSFSLHSVVPLLSKRAGWSLALAGVTSSGLF